jgi:Skp family chaperone for outer membrane proteins
MKHEQAVKRVAPKVFAVVAVSAALTLGAISLQAVERPFPPRSPERIVSHLSERLDLTAEQQALLTPILKESFNRHREIEKKYGKQERELRRAAREERRTVESGFEGQLVSVLTAEQMEEYQKLQDDRRSHRREGARRPGRSKGMRGDRMSPDRVLMHLSERLDLSAEQEDRFLPILEENFDQRREFFESLRSQEMIERSAVRRQMEDLAAGLEEQAAAVLTAEQMEEFRQIQEERHSMKGERFPFGGRGKF